jgi:hypothetical protein
MDDKRKKNDEERERERVIVKMKQILLDGLSTE